MTWLRRERQLPVDMQVGQGTGEQREYSAGQPASAVRSRRKWLRPLLLAGLYGCIALLALFSVQLIRYTIRFPDPRALSINEAGPTIRILARDGSVLAERGERNDFVRLDRLPRHLVNAVISIEDRRFFDHWGLDPSGLARAMFANLRAGRTVQGGSTLTQQLAKNLFLSTERTFSRKLEELVLSLWLELRLSKREVLELYLNRVYFGGGAYGVEAAARRFFNKPAQAVSVAEAAVIAGLLKAPSKYSPFANPGHARGRARIVLKAMRAAGHLSPVAYLAAMRQSVHFADPEAGRRPTGIEYALDYVLDHLPTIASIGKRELIVETTIDTNLQKLAQATIEKTLESKGKAANVDQAALVVLDTEGGIRALVGGRSFAQSQFNRAVKSRRQPGSAFKPFVYLAAIEQGMGPDTPVQDAPIEIAGWSPRNDDGRYRGPIALRHALAHSVNTVAVRLQQEIGLGKIASVAKRLGITSNLRLDASLALGTSEVGLLELTGAYGVLAAGGAAIEAHAIERVSLAGGPVIYERRGDSPRMIVAPDTVGAMNTMLNGVIVAGTGRKAAIPRHQAAGKTGTTQDFRDAWFVGYTAHLIGGVWFGNDDGKPMSRVSGGSLPAEVWRAIMLAAHAGLAPRPLPAIDPLLAEPDATAITPPPRQPPTTRRLPVATNRLPPLPSRRRAAATALQLHQKARPVPKSTVPAARKTAPVTNPALSAAANPATGNRMPTEPIDPALFAAALGSSPANSGEGTKTIGIAASATSGASTSTQVSGFNAERIRQTLGARQREADHAARMGLGLAGR